MSVRQEITIQSSRDRGDIIISVELDEMQEPRKTIYDRDAERLFRVLWGGVPSGTVERLFLKMVEANEEDALEWWEDFKRKKGWID